MAFFTTPWAQPASGKRKRGPRNPPKSGKERLDLEEARFLVWCKQHDSDLYKQIMKKRAGISDSGSEIDRAIALQEKLKKLQGGEERTGTLDKVIEGVFGFLAGGGVAMAERAGVVTVPGQQQQRVPPAAAPLPEASQPVLPPTKRRRGPRRKRAERAVARAAAGGITASQFFMDGLQGKGPTQAAEWLLSRPEQIAIDLVQQLANLPEPLLGRALDRLATDEAWAPLAAWLRQNEDWTLQTMREVKRLARQQPVAS